MKKQYWLGLIGGVLLLAGMFVWTYGESGPAPASLLTTALKAGSQSERTSAASKLILLKGPEALTQIRRLATESEDAEVLVLAMTGLAAANDTASISVFYNGMDHPVKAVREVSFGAVQRFMGGPLPENLDYKVDDPAEKRSKVVNKLKEIQKEHLDKMNTLKPPK